MTCHVVHTCAHSSLGVSVHLPVTQLYYVDYNSESMQSLPSLGSRPSPFTHASACGTRIVAQEWGRPGLKYHVRVGSG